MITCREATELHTAADEGALTGAKRVLYDLHMKMCGPCKRFRSQLHATTDVIRGMPKKDEDPPADLVELLAKEIDDGS